MDIPVPPIDSNQIQANSEPTNAEAQRLENNQQVIPQTPPPQKQKVQQNDPQVPIAQTPQVPSEVKTRKLQTEKLKEIFTNESVEPIGYINTVLSETVRLSASDILFEPRRNNVVIRARIDGVLYELGIADHAVYEFLVARVKVLASLDTANKIKIQEGQFVFEVDGRVVNMRVEIVQTVHGEMIVIRVHELSTIVMNLKQLGFSDEAYISYQQMIKKQAGLILVCGPTGSGKTTTLYSTISKLNEHRDFNVMTIENPVEFQLDGVNQMQANEDHGFSFAQGLHTVLRLSPDIVFVGEIRDLNTAKIAVESGLTGHLVFSTIHASDSVGTLFRLIDLGIETYLLNSALSGVISQRLVRMNCPNCLAQYQPTEEELDIFRNVIGRDPQNLYKSTGCDNCNNLAFKGRVGIFEVLTVDSYIRNIMRQEFGEDEIRNLLRQEGLTTILKDGLLKAEKGVTTIHEVLRNSLRID